jgi:hypothetical protein
MSQPGTYASALSRRLLEADAREPATRLYAVLDGARDPSIHRWALKGLLEHCCLYAGRLSPELAEVAPYLVSLLPEAPSTQSLLEAAWGQSWGIFLRTAVPMEALRNHLRKFLRVRDSRGRVLVFRYYDPRVLRVYLPTCDARELEAVFGPIRHFYAEAEGGGTLLDFSREGPGLLAQSIILMDHS